MRCLAPANRADCLLRWFPRQALNRDDDGRHDERQRSDDPHDGSGSDLIFQRGEAKQSGRRRIRGIEHAIGEDQDRRQRGVLKIGDQQIRHHRPARPLRAAGPRLHHRPPEDQRSEKEAGMFDLVPCRRTQRQFVQRRRVPGEHRDAHQQQSDRPDGSARVRCAWRPASSRTARQTRAPQRSAARAPSGSAARPEGSAEARPSSAPCAAACGR